MNSEVRFDAEPPQSEVPPGAGILFCVVVLSIVVVTLSAVVGEWLR